MFSPALALDPQLALVAHNPDSKDIVVRVLGSTVRHSYLRTSGKALLTLAISTTLGQMFGAHTRHIEHMTNALLRDSSLAQLATTMDVAVNVICSPHRLTTQTGREHTYAAVFTALVGATLLQHNLSELWLDLVDLVGGWLSCQFLPQPHQIEMPYPNSPEIPGDCAIAIDRCSWRTLRAEEIGPMMALSQFRELCAQMQLDFQHRTMQLHPRGWGIIFLVEGDEVGLAWAANVQLASQAAAVVAMTGMNWPRAIARAGSRTHSARSQLYKAPSETSTMDMEETEDCSLGPRNNVLNAVESTKEDYVMTKQEDHVVIKEEYVGIKEEEDVSPAFPCSRRG